MTTSTLATAAAPAAASAQEKAELRAKYLREFRIVKVDKDYRNLHGELIAAAGAVGIVWSNDRNLRGVDFADDESGSYVALDGCGRKFHSIPMDALTHIYK